MATQQKVVVFPKETSSSVKTHFTTFDEVADSNRHSAKGSELLNQMCWVAIGGNAASLIDSQWRADNRMVIGSDDCLYVLIKGPNNSSEGGIHIYEPGTLLIIEWSDLSLVECAPEYYFNGIKLMEAGFQITFHIEEKAHQPKLFFSCAKGWLQHLPIYREIEKLKSELEIPFDHLSDRKELYRNRNTIAQYQMKQQNTTKTVIAKETYLKITELEPSYFHNVLKTVAKHKELRHPNIVAKDGFFILNGNFCYLCEYVELLPKIETSKMTVSEQSKILFGLVQGLQYLHSKGIAHMNLSLESILINKDLSCKLNGFDEIYFSPSFAGVVSNSTYGTPQYLAPEMFKLEKRDFGKDCQPGDIYSVGIIIWAFVTGLTPFERMRAADVSRKVSVPPSSGNKYNPDARPPLKGTLAETSPFKSIIEDCWTHDAKLRPTIDELVTRVKEL